MPRMRIIVTMRLNTTTATNGNQKHKTTHKQRLCTCLKHIFAHQTIQTAVLPCFNGVFRFTYIFNVWLVISLLVPLFVLLLLLVFFLLFASFDRCWHWVLLNLCAFECTFLVCRQITACVDSHSSSSSSSNGTGTLVCVFSATSHSHKPAMDKGKTYNRRSRILVVGSRFWRLTDIACAPLKHRTRLNPFLFAHSLALLAVFVCRERPTTYVIKCTVHYYYHYYTYFGLLVAHIMITYYFHCDFDSTYKTVVRNMGDFFLLWHFTVSKLAGCSWKS